MIQNGTWFALWSVHTLPPNMEMHRLLVPFASFLVEGSHEIRGHPPKNKLRWYPQQHAALFLVLAPPRSPRRTSWNPGGTLVEPYLRAAPDHPRAWAETPKLSAEEQEEGRFAFRHPIEAASSRAALRSHGLGLRCMHRTGRGGSPRWPNRPEGSGLTLAESAIRFNFAFCFGAFCQGIGC